MRSKSSHSASMRRTPEVGKWVTVIANGNPHQEHRILVSPYTMRDFGNLLSHITEKLKPSFGAVWRLFTTSGQEIFQLDDIQGGGRYVAYGRGGPCRTFHLGLRINRTRVRRQLRSQSAVASYGVQGTDLVDRSSDTNVTKSRSAKCGPRRRKDSGHTEHEHGETDQPWEQPPEQHRQFEASKKY